MKKIEAIPLASAWSKEIIEYIAQILNTENVQARLKLTYGKINNQRGSWCSFEIQVSDGFERRKITGIPSDFDFILGNQILDDIVEKLFPASEYDFSYFQSCPIKGMMANNYFSGLQLAGKEARMRIDFASCIPDEMHIKAFNEALDLREERKNSPKL